MADGFKIADGYVEVHGVVDRRSIIAAADQVTRGVSDQMATGVAFGNLREGGRKMGAVLGEHGGPSAAREVTEGLTQWIDQGQSAGHVSAAGQKLGDLLGRAGGSPFVQHLLTEIDRRVAESTGGASGSDGERGGTSRSGGTSGDGRDRTGGGADGGRGGEGGRGGAGGDAEADGRSLGERIGLAAAQGFLGSFLSGISGLGSAVISSPVLGTAAVLIGGALATLAAPAFGAAFAAALIGGAGFGVIGLGAFLLKDDPQVKAAAGSLAKTAGAVFKGGAAVLVEPFVNSMAILENLLVKIAPDISAMFTSIAPAIVPLTRGFAGFVEGALPGFLALIEAATPFLMDLENTLPRFGDQIGQFLAVIAEAGPGATLFFRDFLNVLGIVLEAFGITISWLARLYEASRAGWFLIGQAFSLGADAARAAFGLIQDGGDRLWRFLAGVWRTVREDGGQAVAWFRGLPGQVVGAISSIPDKVQGVFRGAGGWLRDAGKAIINGLIGGIRSMIPDLTGLLGSITNMIPDWKGPPAKDRELLEPTGRMIMEGLGRGIAEGAQGVREDLGAVTTSLPGAAAPGPAPAPRGPITINIQGVWDFTKGIPDGLIAALYAALDRYERGYA